MKNNKFYSYVLVFGYVKNGKSVERGLSGETVLYHIYNSYVKHYPSEPNPHDEVVSKRLHRVGLGFFPHQKPNKPTLTREEEEELSRRRTEQLNELCIRYSNQLKDQ